MPGSTLGAILVSWQRSVNQQQRFGHVSLNWRGRLGFKHGRISYLSRWWKKNLWVVLLLVPLFIPLSKQYVPVSPVPAELDEFLNAIMPGPPVSSAAPFHFKMFVPEGPGNEGVRSITFPIATYARRNDCELSIQVDGAVASGPVSCASLEDNAPAEFVFQKVVPSGVREAVLISTAKNADNSISPYVSRARSGEYWIRLLVYKGRPLSGGLLTDWAQNHPGSGSVLCFAFLCFLAVSVFSPAGIVKWLVLLAFHFTAIILLTPMLSGHDETAHIHMFFLSQLKALGVTDAEAAARTQEFYDRVEEMKKIEGFYVLNAAKEMPRGTCPHGFAGSCGVSAGPQRLYDVYAKIFQIDKNRVSDPFVLAATFIGLNTAQVILLLVIVSLTFPAPYLKTLISIFVLCGFAAANIPSITNDLLMELLGLLGLIVSVSCVRNSSLVRSLISLSFFSLLVTIVGSKVDKSWQAGLLTMGFSACVIGYDVATKKVRWLNTGAQIVPRRLSIGAGLVAAMAYAAFVLILVPAITKFGAGGLRTAISYINSGTANLSNNLSDLPIRLYPEIMWEHFRSVIGSYIWGHAYYPNYAYALAAVLGAGFAFSGFFLLLRSESKARFLMVALLLGGTTALYLSGVIGICAGWIGSHATLDAISKVRFMAPGVAVVLALPAIAINHWMQNTETEDMVYRLTAFWSSLVTTHFLPVIFILPNISG